MTVRRLIALASVALILPAPLWAQEPHASEAPVPTAVPVTVEAYYRVRWGNLDEFMELFERNHLPILREAESRGMIRAIRMDTPFNHMTGEARWDLRVTIEYRDATVAMMTDPAWTAVFDETIARIAPDADRFAAEERRRFEIVDEHWDVVLYPDI